MAGGNWGVYASTITNGAIVSLSLARSVVHNAFYALASETNGSGQATMNVSDSMVAGNNFGVYQDGSGSILQSYGNNQIGDNSSDHGTLTSVSLN
jgi:hypothetical protein